MLHAVLPRSVCIYAWAKRYLNNKHAWAGVQTGVSTGKCWEAVVQQSHHSTGDYIHMRINSEQILRSDFFLLLQKLKE